MFTDEISGDGMIVIDGEIVETVILLANSRSQSWPGDR